MANPVPVAPSAPTLLVPTTGAATVATEMFGVLLDRGQDFIDRTIAALNDLSSLPSQIVPRVPVVNWSDPTLVRPAATAGAPPEAPIIPIEAAQQIIFDWLADPDPTVRRSYEASTFARASDRALAESARITSEATTRWAAAGFDLPPGMLNAQIDQAQKRASDVIAQASFEAMTREQDLQIEKYKLCISAGLNALLDVYKSEVSQYLGERNADVQALNAEVQVYSANVQAIVQRVTMELRGTEIENNVLIANLQLIEKAMGEIAQTYAQLAAGATSALHASTGFSDSADFRNSISESWQTGWNFSADY